MNSTAPARLEVQDLQVRRGSRTVLDIPHLVVYPNEVLAVIGPNGSGKSTLLLALSQLLQPSAGQVLFNGSPLRPQHSLDYRRRIGLVLQDPLLLDTTVFANVAAGLRFRGMRKQEIRPRVEQWLDKLGIGALQRRPAKSLSGGEAQRTSLARAFALQPEVLLLDEPFSALDAPSRARLLEDFQALVAETAVTCVFVTHDLDEALLLGDRIAVLIDGKLRQVDTPDVIFNAPADAEVAAFSGVETIIPGQVVSTQDSLLTIQAGAFTLTAVGNAALGHQVLACLRPEDVTLFMKDDNLPGEIQAGAGENHLQGMVTGITPQGPLVRVVIDCGLAVVALITRSAAQEMDLAPGKEVQVGFKANAVHLIDRIS
jgi:molybdopterin-binding protein